MSGTGGRKEWQQEGERGREGGGGDPGSRVERIEAGKELGMKETERTRHGATPIWSEPTKAPTKETVNP